MAETAAMYNFKNGLDSWRKLYHDQLPAIAHQKGMLLNEFQTLSQAIGLNDLKKRISDIERITSRWLGLSQAPLNEEHKISKIQTLLPLNIYNCMAVNLGSTKSYHEIVQLIEAQTKDPATGLMRGEEVPSLANAQPDPQHERIEQSDWQHHLSEQGIGPDAEVGLNRQSKIPLSQKA